MTAEKAAAQLGTHLLRNVKRDGDFYTLEQIRQSIKGRGIVGSLLILPLAHMGLERPVQFLLEKGADIETRSPSYSFTPLIIAACQQKENVVRVLLETGAKVNSVGGNGTTALIQAAHVGNLGIVRLLVEKGANTKFKSTDGRTALQYASRYPEVAQYLQNK
jgi:ankyrin repeat protein